MGPEQTPLPDLAFYYAISIILGTLLTTVLGFIAVWYVRSNDATQKELKNSITSLAKHVDGIGSLVMLHEHKHKENDEDKKKYEADLKRKVSVEENTGKIMFEMLKTLDMMMTKLGIMQGKHERDYKDPNK